MVAKDRRIAARKRARALQQADTERLERLQKARTDAFLALDTIDAGREALGVAIDQLLAVGEAKKKIADDFGLTTRDVNEILDLVGSDHAPAARSKNTSPATDGAADREPAVGE